MTVESIRLRLLLIGPVRLVLGVVFLGAARAAGGSSAPTLLAFDASVAPAWLHAFHAALPSTIGVSILALVTLPFNRTLTALLAGILAGLGLAALLLAFSIDDRLYVEPRQNLVFRK